LGLLNGEQGDVLENLIARNPITTSDHVLAVTREIPSEPKAGLEFFPIRRCPVQVTFAVNNLLNLLNTRIGRQG
jgi:hypothetical protein